MAEPRSPGPVPKDALAYWRGKDLRPGFDYQDVWGDEHAHAYTVAKMTRLDLLDDTRASLDAALAEGKTFRQWSNEIRPQLQRKGWWGIKDEIDPATGEIRKVQLGSPRRLKTIYRSNMRSARAAGQWQRIQRNKETQPMLVYLLGPSDEHRAEHETLQGLTLPVDDPAWQEIYPPNGYGCKCHVSQITREQAQAYQDEGVPDVTAPQEVDPETGQPTGRRVTRRVPAKTEMPELPRKRFVNKRTGEIQYSSAGIHPAWANNTGQARVRVIREHLAQRVATADQQMARAAAADIVDSPVFENFQRTAAARRDALAAGDRSAIDAVGELPIGVVPGDLQRALSSSGQVLRMSAQDMAKQMAKRPEMSGADYRRVQEVLDRGVVVRQDNRLVLFQPDGDRYRQVVLKATGKRDKLYMNSYHLADAKAFRRAMRRAREDGEVVRSAPQ
ncbi:MAG: phage minor head protein [Salinisphaeraceae bacterium]